MTDPPATAGGTDRVQVSVVFQVGLMKGEGVPPRNT